MVVLVVVVIVNVLYDVMGVWFCVLLFDVVYICVVFV